MPQIGWFWNYVEQCAQAEKAEACLLTACERNYLAAIVYVSHLRSRCPQLLSWWTGMLSLPRSSCGLDSLHLTVSGSESYAPLPLIIQFSAFTNTQHQFHHCVY